MTRSEKKFVLQWSSSVHPVPNEAAESGQVWFNLFQRDDHRSSQFVVEQFIVRGGMQSALACQTKQDGVIPFGELWSR